MEVLNLCVLTNNTVVPLNLNCCHKAENGKGRGNICSHLRDGGLYQEQGERQRTLMTYQLGCLSRLAAGVWRIVKNQFHWMIWGQMPTYFGQLRPLESNPMLWLLGINPHHKVWGRNGSFFSPQSYFSSVVKIFLGKGVTRMKARELELQLTKQIFPHSISNRCRTSILVVTLLQWPINCPRGNIQSLRFGALPGRWNPNVMPSSQQLHGQTHKVPLVDITHMLPWARAPPDGHPAYQAHTCSPQDPLMSLLVLVLNAVCLSQPQKRVECLGAGKLSLL